MEVEKDLSTESNIDFDDSKVVIIRDGPIPRIEFADQLEHKLAKRWSKSAIVKLLGKGIGYNTLISRL